MEIIIRTFFDLIIMIVTVTVCLSIMSASVSGDTARRFADDCAVAYERSGYSEKTGAELMDEARRRGYRLVLTHDEAGEESTGMLSGHLSMYYPVKIGLLSVDTGYQVDKELYCFFSD